MSTIQLDLPKHVRDGVEAMAVKDGVSAEQLMVVAIAQMVAEERARSRRHDPDVVAARERLMSFLERVPARKPMKGDEMPAKLRKQLEKKFPVLKRLAKK